MNISHAIRLRLVAHFYVMKSPVRYQSRHALPNGISLLTNKLVAAVLTKQGYDCQHLLYSFLLDVLKCDVLRNLRDTNTIKQSFMMGENIVLERTFYSSTGVKNSTQQNSCNFAKNKQTKTKRNRNKFLLSP